MIDATEPVVTISALLGVGADAHQLVHAGAWSFTVWEATGDGEARMRDLDAGERLGFRRQRKIRDLIRRTYPGKKLNDIHQRPIVGRPGQVADPGGIEFWLTEAQLLKLCARSETPIADAILDDMIRVYMLVRRGLLAPASASTKQLEARFAAIEAQLAASQRAAMENERRWWQRLANTRLRLLTAIDSSADAAIQTAELALDQINTEELRQLGCEPGPSYQDILERHEEAQYQARLKAANDTPRLPSPELPVPKGFGHTVWTAAERLPRRQRDMVRVLGAWCDERGVVNTTYTQIGKALGAGPESAKALCNKLVAAGWIFVIDGPTRTATRAPWILRLMVPERS